MADRFWVATVSPADWNHVDSWSATRGGASGASVPGSSDTAYVEGNGTVAPDTNLSANTAILVALIWSASYPMGSSSTPLGVTATTVKIRNTSYVNLQSLGSSGIRYLDIDLASNAQVNLSVASTGGFSGDGSNAGYVHINCAANISGEVCSVSGSVLRVFGGRATLDYNSSACQKAEVDAGAKLEFARAINTVQLSAGAKAEGQNNAPIATGLYVEPNAVYTHNSYGTIALADVKPGGKAGAANNPYNFTLTSRVRRKGADNFTDTSKISGTPVDIGVGSVSVI